MKGIWQSLYEFKERLRSKRTRKEMTQSRIEEEGVEIKLNGGGVKPPVPWIGRGSDTPSERRRDGGRIIKESNG